MTDRVTWFVAKAPAVGALVGAVASLAVWLAPNAAAGRDYSAFFAACCASWSALLGFVLAAQTILLSQWGHARFDRLRGNANLSAQLWGAFKLALLVLGVSAAVALVSLLPIVPSLISIPLNLLGAGASIGAVWRCATLVTLVVEKAQD